MKNSNMHWTQDSDEKFLFRISTDFLSQLLDRVQSQNELAKKLNITKGAVSQTLRNPGNLKLKTMVKYARALDLKVSVVAYPDIDDPNGEEGPIHADIFRLCWEKKNRPRDFWAFQLPEPKTEDAINSDDLAGLNKAINIRTIARVDAANSVDQDFLPIAGGIIEGQKKTA